MTEAEKLQRAEALLREAGFRLYIYGCECSYSPWVALEKDGEMITIKARRLDRSKVKIDD